MALLPRDVPLVALNVREWLLWSAYLKVKRNIYLVVTYSVHKTKQHNDNDCGEAKHKVFNGKQIVNALMT